MKSETKILFSDFRVRFLQNVSDVLILDKMLFLTSASTVLNPTFRGLSSCGGLIVSLGCFVPETLSNHSEGDNLSESSEQWITDSSFSARTPLKL